MQALEVLQTWTFYYADNGEEMRAKVNAFSKLYDISINKAKTQKERKGKNHKNVACKNSSIYKKLPIFRTNKPYFIRV